MKYNLANAIIALTVLVIPAATASAQLSVYAQIDASQTIYVGENFSYHVVIDGDNKAGQVDLSSLAMFNPQHGGNRDLSQTSINMINGKTTRKVTKRYVMSYSLVSSRVGQITIPSVTVTVDGQNYRTKLVAVNVVKPGTTDKLEMVVTLSEKRCYAGQPVLMSVKVYVSAEIRDLALNVPAFNGDKFFFEDPDTISPGAKEVKLSVSSSQTVYVTQTTTTHKGKAVTLLAFEKVLIPKRSGMQEIPAASVSADVAVGRRRAFFGYEPVYKRFMVHAKPLSLEVLALPESAKPKEFYGLVGSYTISASAEPTNVNVLEPITMTIKIGGNRYLKPVRWPDLDSIKAMAENFKIPVEHSPAVVQEGVKVFTQTIRPNNERVTEIPAIPLVYFDSEKGRYVTAKSKPIQLVVAPTRVLTGADFEGRDFMPGNREIESIKQGLSANYTDFSVLVNQNFSPLSAAYSPGYAVIWLTPFALLVVSAIVRLTTHTSAEKIAARRRRLALSRAVRLLKMVKSSNVTERCELLVGVMKQYIGERFDKTVASLTPDDCREIIVGAITDERIAEDYCSIMADCEATRFSPLNASVDGERVKHVSELMWEIEKKANK